MTSENNTENKVEEKKEWKKPTVETIFVKDTENNTQLFAQDAGPHCS